jgi:hypothetical protein
MNLEKATTEAFAVYNNFHNDLNVTSKVSIASVNTIRRIVDIPNGDKIMGQFVDSLEMPWGKGKSFPKPTKTLDTVINNLAYNALLQAFSGFEFFLTHLIADLANFSKLQMTTFKHAHTDSDYNPRTPPSFPKCCFAYAEQYSKSNILSNRIKSLKNDLGITDPILDNLLGIFNYFRLVRNCIIHLEGMVDKDLMDQFESNEFIDSYKFWNRNFSRSKAPTLPSIERGKKIDIKIFHSIFASAVNYKIGQIFNKKAIEILDVEGVVKMASYYSILIDKHEYRTIRKANSADASVSNYLSNRYLVKSVTKEKTISQLKALKLWKTCQDRFSIINS